MQWLQQRLAMARHYLLQLLERASQPGSHQLGLDWVHEPAPHRVAARLLLRLAAYLERLQGLFLQHFRPPTASALKPIADVASCVITSSIEACQHAAQLLVADPLDIEFAFPCHRYRLQALVFNLAHRWSPSTHRLRWHGWRVQCETWSMCKATSTFVSIAKC